MHNNPSRYTDPSGHRMKEDDYWIDHHPIHDEIKVWPDKWFAAQAEIDSMSILIDKRNEKIAALKFLQQVYHSEANKIQAKWHLIQSNFNARMDAQLYVYSDFNSSMKTLVDGSAEILAALMTAGASQIPKAAANTFKLYRAVSFDEAARSTGDLALVVVPWNLSFLLQNIMTQLSGAIS